MAGGFLDNAKKKKVDEFYCPAHAELAVLDQSL
jgi:hypothetical protein